MLLIICVPGHKGRIECKGPIIYPNPNLYLTFLVANALRDIFQQHRNSVLRRQLFTFNMFVWRHNERMMELGAITTFSELLEPFVMSLIVFFSDFYLSKLLTDRVETAVKNKT